jgi:hypothetical protein
VALDLAQRLHAFLHSFAQPNDALDVRNLYEQVSVQFAAQGIDDKGGRGRLIADIALKAAARLGVSDNSVQLGVVHALTFRLFASESLFVLPSIDWTEHRTTTEWWNLRDVLAIQRELVGDFDRNTAILVDAIAGLLAPLYQACPALLGRVSAEDGISIETELLESVSTLGATVEAMLGVAFAADVVSSNLLSTLRERLERNLVAASGGNSSNVKGFNRAFKLPSKADTHDRRALVASYLGGTPLAAIFSQPLTFNLPTRTRFEHHHIVAGSGHGKTQTLQYLIGQDLAAVAEGQRSVVVLDSQGDLIRTISSLAVFAPGGVLHDRIVIIDPTDVEWPVSLNLFDVGQERLAGYDPLERERLTNSILELYDFVLGTLLSAEMTQKQNVIFRYVTRLMLHIPDATIHTLRELMEPGSQVRFAADIAKLTGSARRFFETEFASREFEQTRKQVLRRLWGILENQTFERMFAHPRSKLDLFAEMNAGKVILINTAKDLLKEQGTEIFGRFFIALIAQAAQERATLPANRRMPTFVYIDEAADYFDRNVGIILSQARKYNVGMVLAHQYLGQLDPKLQEAVAANTAIKFAGGVSNKDARSIASMLGCSTDFIEGQPKGSFAAHVRGETKGAVPLRMPFGHLEAQPVMSEADGLLLRDRMRERYAIHHSELDAEAAGQPTVKARPPLSPGHINTHASVTW